MQVIGIKELQTKHGQPLGLALSFAEGIMEQGLLPWFAIKGFQSGDLSLGQLSKALGKNQLETIKLLELLGVPVADYDFAEDLAAIEKMLAA
jgi:hypothetical protein